LTKKLFPTLSFNYNFYFISCKTKSQKKFRKKTFFVSLRRFYLTLQL